MKLPAFLSATLVASAAFAQAPATLQLNTTGARDLRVGYYPVPIELSAEKPAGVKKEPKYASTPKYGVIHVGNGPKSTIVIALDEPSPAEARIYVDANANGDLTDDGDGSWAKKRLEGERPMLGLQPMQVRASWGDAKKETSTGAYGLAFYRFPSQPYLLMYREATRSGMVKIDGADYKATLLENDANGLFKKYMDTKGVPTDAAGTPLPKGKGTNPVWLVLQQGEGKPVQVDTRAPFVLNGKNYEANVSQDGKTLSVKATTKAAYAPPPPPERKPLLAAGTMAPDFTCYTLDGKPVKLSDFKGKTVVMDFWATWCGPCMVTMPHVEKVWEKVKGRDDVVVIGVCVWDEKDAYEKWVPKNNEKFTFPLLFDPAGRGAESIAGKLFNVSGIPTTYVIDKDGKIATSLVGSKDIPEKLGGELKKLGIEAE
ncbi:MAG: TlpA disulfide reductase family protein [Armatimonas sp.]